MADGDDLPSDQNKWLKPDSKMAPGQARCLSRLITNGETVMRSHTSEFVTSKRELLVAHSRRNGFTLTELLAAVAVIGSLLALLLPALQSAREAARRTQCANNLQQLGLALHNYHERYGSFPPSTVVDWNQPEPTGYWSWIARILPELDERPLYERLDLREDVWTNCNKYKPYTSQRLAVLLCPSDPHNERIYESDEECPGGEAYALTNYLGCRGSTRQSPPSNGVYPTELPGNGVFPDVNRVARLKQILDGTSQTILLGERPADMDAYWGWWAAGRGVDDHGLGDYVMDVSEGLHAGDLIDGAHLSHYWSAHPGGAQFAMCDGSVRFLLYSIDEASFLALGSRNEGEVVSGL
jgi:prepilin-type N-terminal cleavage/methylation domain-containing protein/prepilin-type processing-associated H-X9-DG protein